jgi:hypothetical protein
VRGAVLIVQHPGGPERAPKPYFVHLDSDGYAIVSERVWQRLEEAKAAGTDHGLVFSNEVRNPPVLQVRVGADEPRPVVPMRTRAMTADGRVVDAGLRAVAQEFAPRGVRAVINTLTNRKPHRSGGVRYG